ncbi:MAG TPA: haloacid dehalogenase type II [Thermomicrobiales bacterium]|jgi:2-haloacid dehalogenase
MSRLSGVRAVLFDAYGTLFRLDSIQDACAAALATVPGNTSTAEEFSILWRAKQLEYSVHRSLMGEPYYVDFAAVTEQALDYALARLAVELPSTERASLLQAWQTPAADPSAPTVLAALAPLPRAILSNGAPAMLATAVAAAGLSDRLDAILSADEVRVYKPHPRVYALGTARFGFLPAEIAFVTGNGWDAAGAAAFGYRVCWINRHGLPEERHGPGPAAVVASLADVPATLGR